MLTVPDDMMRSQHEEKNSHHLEITSEEVVDIKLVSSFLIIDDVKLFLSHRLHQLF